MVNVEPLPGVESKGNLSLLDELLTALFCSNRCCSDPKPLLHGSPYTRGVVTSLHCLPRVSKGVSKGTAQPANLRVKSGNLGDPRDHEGRWRTS